MRSILLTCGVLAFALAVASSGAVKAQETLGAHYAALGPQDYRNSKGVPLTSFSAVLQQDRANYHRFGNADLQDEDDPFFANREARAAIPALYAAADNSWWDRNMVAATSAPLDADVFVVLCGSGGRLTHLIVNHANGDGYVMCEGKEQAGN